MNQKGMGLDAEGRRWGLMVLLIIVAIIAAAFAVAALTYSPGPEIDATGRMFVSTSGDWNGTETAEYDVSLEFHGNDGTLSLTLRNGSFDPVQNSTLEVFSVRRDGDEYSLQTEAGLLQFVKYYIEDEDVFNGTAIEAYVALWSDERDDIGQIDPNLFGMPDSYFVAMVLKER